MIIIYPACRVSLSCEAESLGCWKLLSAFLYKMRLHSKTNKPAQEGTDSISNRQQSQRKLLLFGKNLASNGVGRLDYYHSSHKTKCVAKNDHNPEERDEMV